MARIQDVRIITLLGGILMSLGILLDVQDFLTLMMYRWQLFMTQAILHGVRSSTYYLPIMSITRVYFDAHRGFAMEFILSGSGAGGLVFVLMSRFGIQWVFASPWSIWNLVVGIPIACVVRKRQGFERSDARARLKLVCQKGTPMLGYVRWLDAKDKGNVGLEGVELPGWCS